MVTENKALTDFMKREMPEGTVIGNARYWSLRISGFLDTLTPPAQAQVVASLREMLELREATQNGRVTEKHELDIVRDARAALSAQPRPAYSHRALGIACTVAWTELVQALRSDGHEVGDSSGPATRKWIVDVVRDTFAQPQPASAPVGADDLEARLEAAERANESLRIDVAEAHNVRRHVQEKNRELKDTIAQQTAAVDDIRRMDWLDRVGHCADWDVDGHQPMKRVVRSDDGEEFCADTWREAIDRALTQQPAAVDEVARLVEAADYAARFILDFSALTYSPHSCERAAERLKEALRPFTATQQEVKS